MSKKARSDENEASKMVNKILEKLTRQGDILRTYVNVWSMITLNSKETHTLHSITG